MSSYRVPTQYPDWLVQWRRYRFPTRRLLGSVSALSIDSAHTALPRPTGSSAEPPAATPADTDEVFPSIEPTHAAARRTFPGPIAIALSRVPRLHTDGRSDAMPVPCVADPTPTP